MKSDKVLGLLLGAVIALTASFVTMMAMTPREAHAIDATGRGDMFAVVGVGYQSQGRDVLFIIDTSSSRVACYEYKNGSLLLQCVRNVKYEMKFEEYGKTRPKVKDMAKQALKGN